MKYSPMFEKWSRGRGEAEREALANLVNTFSLCSNSCDRMTRRRGGKEILAYCPEVFANETLNGSRCYVTLGFWSKHLKKPSFVSNQVRSKSTQCIGWRPLKSEVNKCRSGQDTAMSSQVMAYEAYHLRFVHEQRRDDMRSEERDWTHAMIHVMWRLTYVSRSGGAWEDTTNGCN